MRLFEGALDASADCRYARFYGAKRVRLHARAHQPRFTIESSPVRNLFQVYCVSCFRGH